MKTALLFFCFLFLYICSFAQDQDYTLKFLLGQTLNKPAGFFITQDDNVFVADYYSYKLFSPEGKLLKELFLDDAYAGRDWQQISKATFMLSKTMKESINMLLMAAC